MIYVFEGARNSGKTHLSFVASSLIGKSFKYEFVEWFRFLNLDTKDISTHIFALGKETMLLQLNREGLLESDFVLDRGIFTVMSWGVLEGRISISDAKKQIDFLLSKDLLSNCKFFHIKGENPNIRGKKDEWDSLESLKEVEVSLIESLMGYAKESSKNSIEIIEIMNEFDKQSEDMIAGLI